MSDVRNLTDKYFTKTHKIIDKLYNKDCIVTYAVFMRSPVRAALKFAIQFIKDNSSAQIASVPEGTLVTSNQPLMLIKGKFSELVELETLLLQHVGLPCICAKNAYRMTLTAPQYSFLDFHARHGTGEEFVKLASYGAWVGSEAAKREHPEAKGFVGASTDVGGAFYGNTGIGTMPHALIGKAGSTLQAAIDYHKVFPNEKLVVLIDYFGKEVTDTKALVNHFGPNADVTVRIDTHGGRYLEGLSWTKSCNLIDTYDSWSMSLRAGQGVSVAAAYKIRQTLDELGAKKWKIIVSSGFDEEKVGVFAHANAPIDMIGTGSFLPQNWHHTYATVDIIKYDDDYKVKVGREMLISKSIELQNKLKE
ncbi:nicotinate phosphoribosyltransferase [Candidatus Pacearchaeota archaeon]|nr:nicotinate phosphoribosyltransferase [Candidatus Pacearchaeota archaeon]|tara:strand:+ start:12508 stop:13596 length:1089 start_codon:yes stop_codon:yes gene_type:complete